MKYKCLQLVFPFLLLYFYSCKKEVANPESKVSIVGKWYLISHRSKLYYHEIPIDSLFHTHFTPNDFIEYFSDGSGIISSNSTPTPLLVSFQYTVNGLNLTQFSSVATQGIPEKITKLTKDSLSIYYVLSITDPDTGVTENETDDFSYIK